MKSVKVSSHTGLLSAVKLRGLRVGQRLCRKEQMVHWDAAAVFLVREGLLLGLLWGIKASLLRNLDLQYTRQHFMRAMHCHGMLPLSRILIKHLEG